tara:strand:+ start:179 stop:382 length:204 start_codon:yes stop_codon:yes gene_type:complete
VAKRKLIQELVGEAPDLLNKKLRELTDYLRGLKGEKALSEFIKGFRHEANYGRSGGAVRCGCTHTED